MQSYHMNTLKNLLADTLCEKTSSYIIEEIFCRFSTLSELFNASEPELLAIKGVGKVKARQIVSALKLARALNVPTGEPYVIRSPKDAALLMTPELGYLQREEFHCIYLNTKNQVIGTEGISVGSLNASIVHPREVFKSAIKKSSCSIICVHNHPSGDPTPSQEDIVLTKRLVDAGEIIGIDVLDHLVISSHSYCSMKEKGYM
ncbi:RadC family protein [Gorillibacterium timonense]|uniref:RadC family protein n=1 Tax=Gorillibacterium timonense TaxID=1689269 RepID=UPI00071DFD99|nr:DNA repair protein RadC [Gorillibacterium timonense]